MKISPGYGDVTLSDHPKKSSLLEIQPLLLSILTVPPFHLQLHEVLWQNFHCQHLGQN